MSATHTLISLVGAIALLLWGLTMVRTGITRGFGADLRRIVGHGVKNRGRAFLAGLGVTMAVQSSTATALIVASFAGRGLMDTAPALAVMLGADVGTTLAAQLLSLDLSLLAPLLVLTGVILHKTTTRTLPMQIGRALIGLGLMLFALGMIVETTIPMRGSPIVRELFAALDTEPLIAVLIAAVLTWMTHSSLAVVLLVMSFASSGAVSMPLALVLVLGANLGGVIAPILATYGEGALAHRVTLGNAAFKIIGVVACLMALPLALPWLAMLGDTPARQIVNFHTAFNFGVALFFIVQVRWAAKIAARLLPFQVKNDAPEQPRFLDASAIETPSVALTCAAREVLRMAECVEFMVHEALNALRKTDAKRIVELRALDNTVDRLYEEIILYVAKISRREIDADESHMATRIVTFAANLEHIGDITENLFEIAAKKSEKQVCFSDEGFSEIVNLHTRVADDLKRAMTIFLSGDIKVARRLVHDKHVVNALESRGVDGHLARLRQGRPESIETSALHMHILKDLRRIHSHITSAAYPILDGAGELRKSRLKKPRPAITMPEHKTAVA